MDITVIFLCETRAQFSFLNINQSLNVTEARGFKYSRTKMNST